MYQDWCIETINEILKMKNLDEGQYGYKMIVKDIIRHYPEIFIVDGQQEHFWTKAISQGGVDLFRRSYIESFLMTRNAYEIAMNGSVDEIRKDLYQEHITPVQYIFEKLKKLKDDNNVSIESCRDCMVQNKLVLLHSKEKGFLDGKNFSNEDVSRLKELVSKVQHKFVVAKTELGEARELIGYGSKCHGSGLFRICKLLTSGVRFVDGNGEVCSDEQLVESLMKDFKEYIISCSYHARSATRRTCWHSKNPKADL